MYGSTSDHKGYLQPLKHTVFKGEKEIVVCDIETWGLEPTPERFALGVVLLEGKYYRFTDIGQMRDFLTSRRMRGKTVFAHNGGGYDYLAIFGKTQVSLKAMYSKSKFILGEVVLRENKNGRAKDKVKFYDSSNLLKASVADIGAAMGLPKGITPDDFKTGHKRELTEQDFTYCEMDCKIIFEALCRFFKLVGKVRPTIASSALAYYRTYHMPRTFEWDMERDIHFAASYYGGRVEIGFKGILDAFEPQYKYDINSLYPYVMKTKFYPEPEKLIKSSNPSARLLMDYLYKYEGMAHCQVLHKPHRFGYLPVTLDSKLVFPTPRHPFWGYWNFPELRMAVSDGMIDILDCNLLVTSTRMKSPFYTFVDSLHSLKQEAEKAHDGFSRMTYKLLMNSGYGKFGERRKEEMHYAERYDFDEHMRLLEDGKRWDWEPLGFDCDDGYYKLENEGLDAFTNHTLMCWASYITSHARCENLRWQKEVYEKGGWCYYTDTDSFVTNVELKNGKALGDLKQEHDRFLEIRAPKDYQHMEYGDASWQFFGDVSSKTKGLPAYAEQTGEDEYEYRTFYTEKSAIRQHKPVGSAYLMRKHLRREYDKGIVGKDGFVTPLLEINEPSGCGINEDTDKQLYLRRVRPTRLL